MCDAVIVPTVRVAHGHLPQVRVVVEGWLVFVQEPQVVQAPRLGRRVAASNGPWNRLLDLRLVQPLDQLHAALARSCEPNGNAILGITLPSPWACAPWAALLDEVLEQRHTPARRPPLHPPVKCGVVLRALVLDQPAKAVEVPPHGRLGAGPRIPLCALLAKPFFSGRERDPPRLQQRTPPHPHMYSYLHIQKTYAPSLLCNQETILPLQRHRASGGGHRPGCPVAL